MKTVRVTLELPPEQLEALVREAVGDFLSKHEAGSPERNLYEAFGAWRDAKLEDGLTYQARLWAGRE